MEKREIISEVSPDIQHIRYQELVKLGREIFSGDESLRDGIINSETVGKAESFFKKAVFQNKPEVYASFWEHTMLAPKLGREIAEDIGKYNAYINPNEVEFILWMHEIGRLITPGDYLRNDLLADRLLIKLGVSEKVRKNFPSLTDLLETGEKLCQGGKNISFDNPLDEDQRKIFDDYIKGMTLTKIIVNIADNLSKFKDGVLFDSKIFKEYLENQETRYTEESTWPSVLFALSKRKAGAILQYKVVERTVGMLARRCGFRYQEVREKFLDYRPKIVIVARHGEVENPSGIVYNRDEYMGDKIIHLSNEGRSQIESLAKHIQSRHFSPKEVISSPLSRATETSEIFKDRLHIGNNVRVVEYLNDTKAPGVWMEQIKFSDFMKTGGNVYDSKRWEKYDHETPQEIVNRMKTALYNIAGSIRPGESVIIVSHGDPIAWLLNVVVDNKMPNPENLRDSIYPAKGSAVAVIFDSKGNYFSAYEMRASHEKVLY